MKNKEINYDNQALWEPIDAGYNLGEKLKKDSFIVMQWNIAPMPIGEGASGVTWFNDVRKLIGYLKYELLRGQAYLMYGYEDEIENPETASLVTYLNHDLSDDEWLQKAQNELRKDCLLLDNAFEAETDEDALSIIEICLEEYNKFFNTFDYTSGVNLLYGVKELRDFINNDHLMENYSDIEDDLLDIVSYYTQK